MEAPPVMPQAPTPASSKFGVWQIATIVLAVLLVGALVFAFSKNSALSDSKDAAAAQSSQIDDLEATSASLQADLDTANAQIAACSAAVDEGDQMGGYVYDMDSWFNSTAEEDPRDYSEVIAGFDGLVDQFLTDAAICDPANYGE